MTRMALRCFRESSMSSAVAVRSAFHRVHSLIQLIHDILNPLVSISCRNCRHTGTVAHDANTKQVTPRVEEDDSATPVQAETERAVKKQKQTRRINRDGLSVTLA